MAHHLPLYRMMMVMVMMHDDDADDDDDDGDDYYYTTILIDLFLLRIRPSWINIQPIRACTKAFLAQKP